MKRNTLLTLTVLLLAPLAALHAADMAVQSLRGPLTTLAPTTPRINGASVMSVAAHAGDLVIAENGKCDYQIVIPDMAQDEIVDRWLLMTAKLMQAAFEKNGFTINVVKEGEKADNKPGIYLGATRFAKTNGINVERHEDWTYYLKAVGKDLIIAGNDKKDPVRTIRFTKTPLALLGTVKGRLRFSARVRRSAVSSSEHGPEPVHREW